MRILILSLLLFGCFRDSAVVDTATGVIKSVPETEGDKYFSLLPWVLTFCGLGVFLFGWYTPDPRDNVPCTVIFGVLLALSLAVARGGERMALVAEIACYVSAVACIAFYIKGYIQKNYLSDSNRLKESED